MKAWQSISLIVTSLLVVGCGELATVPTEAPHEATPRLEVPDDSGTKYISAGNQSPPNDVPSPFIGHYTWLDVSVDVGWSSPNTAYGQAIVKFWGSNATASIELKVRNAQGSLVGENSATSQDWYLIPWRSTLYASTSVTVSGTCGHVAQATARGSVWDSAISSAQGFLSWGNKGGAATNSASQPLCPPPTCADPSASNYGGPLPCAYPPPPPPTGGDGSTPPSTGTPTPPPTYQPAPFVPSGHWECYSTNVGTDYEVERCTWYGDYDRIAKSSPSFALNAGRSGSRALVSGDVPSVFVIVSDQVPAGAMGVIERRKQGPYRNVLLVPSATVRPAVLVAALRALAESRSAKGEVPAKDLQRILSGDVLDQQIPAATRSYAATFTSLIARAKRADAGTYGTRQIVEIGLADAK